MASQIRTGIRLDGDASGMKAAFVEGEKAIGRLNRAIDQVRFGNKALINDLGEIGGGLTKIASAIAGWQIGRVILSAADDMTVLKSRLKLVTDNSNELAYVQQRLFGIAQQSRVNYAELGATYAQIARAAGDLGVSQERMLGVTQTIGQAMAISGGSAESMKAALVQLSQGLASGTLRGEELNSVMEQTPRLAQAIAQGMGVSIGQLRALGQDGKLTALSVVEALEKAAPALKREFDQVTPTISGSFTTLKNSSALFIEKLDTATGSSKSLASGLTTLAGSITTVADSVTSNQAAWNTLLSIVSGAAAVGALALGWGAVASGLGRVAALLAANPGLAMLMLGGGALNAAVTAQSAYNQTEAGAVGRVSALQARIAQLDEQIARGGNSGDLARLQANRARVSGQLDSARTRASAFSDRSSEARDAFRASERSDMARTEAAAMFPGAKPLEEVRKYSKLAVDVQREAYDQSVDIAKSYQNRIKLATNDPERLALTREMNARLIQVDKDAKKELKSIAEQGAAEAKQLAEAQFGLKKADLEKGAALDRADLEQKQRTNEQLYKLGLLDVDEYYQRRADLGLADIAISTRLVQAELAQARALASSAQRAEDKAQAQARVLGLEKELIELGAKRTATAEEPVNQRAQRLKEEEDRLQNEASAARRAANVRAYDDAKQLELDIKALRISFIRDPQLQARFQLADDLQTRRDKLLDGVTSPDARQQAMDRFNEYAAAKAYELADRMKPGWQRMVESWQDTTMLMRDTYADTMESVLRTGEDTFIQWAKTGKASAKGLVDVVISEMARMSYRQNIAGPLSSALSAGLSYLFGGFDSTALPTGDFSRLDRVQQRASGGSYGQGLVLRGESGPELSWENTGGYVFNASQTRDILAGAGAAGSGSPGVTVNVINQNGSQVDVQQRQTSNGMQIDVLITQLQDAMADNLSVGSGNLARAMEGRYGLRTAVS